MKKPLVFFALFCAIAIAACKKDSIADGSLSENQKSELLTKEPWLIGSAEFKVGDAAWTSEKAEPCDLDNTWKFEKDNTITLDHGALKCSVDDPQSATTKWNFADAGNSIVLNLDGEEKFSIESLTPDEMILLHSEVKDGVTYLYKVSYKK